MPSQKSITLIAGLALLCLINMSQEEIKLALFEVRPVIYSSGPSKLYQRLSTNVLEFSKTYVLQCSAVLKSKLLLSFSVSGNGSMVYKNVMHDEIHDTLIMESEFTVDFCNNQSTAVFNDFSCEIRFVTEVFNYPPVYKTLFVRKCREDYSAEKRSHDLSTLIVTYVVCLGATVILSILVSILFIYTS